MVQPTVLASRGGLLEAMLECRVATNQVGGRTITTPTYNGSLPGPTLSLRPGETLRVHLVNNLPANTDPVPADLNIPHHPGTTNLHTHGFHVSPRRPSDDIFLVIPPGESFSYEYRLPVNHPPGTYFYHPHHHGSVATQMWGGMAGCIIVEGEIDQVPEIAQARQAVMVFQELGLDQNGVVPPFDIFTFFQLTTKTFTLNGRLNPTLRMKPGEVQRWRLVNANVTDFLHLSLDGHSFHLLSVDGNTLPALRQSATLLMSMANRLDVLVKAGAPGSYLLRKLSLDQGVGANPESILATVVVDDDRDLNMPLPSGPLPVPSQLAPVADAQLTGARQLTFSFLPDLPFFAVDNKHFDAGRIDQTVVLGAAEEWTVFNDSGGDHPFHIHINPFQLLAVNGQPVEPTWQDTVIVPRRGSVRFRTRFLDFEGLQVLHCHVLVHECMGMMQVVDVVPPNLPRHELSARKRELARVLASLPRSSPTDDWCGAPDAAPRNRLTFGRPQSV
ncbi:MAG: multicopper oxidase domain-containing protein [Candidatus Eremiobacterota bacterium]